jgi:hypothetical protein
VAKIKRRNSIAESWIAYPRSMLESPAFRVLSHAAMRVMHRIEIEHMAHGGAENGKLIVTYDQLVEWGVDRKAIAPAIRELTALGFLEVTEPGSAGNENHRRAHRFRLTYVNVKSREQPTNEWKRIDTIEVAKHTVAAVKRETSPRARDLGKRSWRARMKSASPVPKTEPTPVPKTEPKAKIPSSQNGTTTLSSESGTTIYNLGA